MTAAMDAGMTGATATPAELGAKFMRLGFGLFVFGLVIGYVPMAHYMHGSFEKRSKLGRHGGKLR
jgi:hypothetical protein